MSVLFFAGVGTAYYQEQKGNPLVSNLGVMTGATDGQPGGNMEGKETRFGITNSALFASSAFSRIVFANPAFMAA